MKFTQRALWRAALAAVVFVLVVWNVPHRWCGREANAWFDGDRATQAALARGVTRWVETDLHGSFSTGSDKFDGEWVFGSYFMAGMGLAQAAIEHPELRDEHLPVIQKCIDRLLDPRMRAFDTKSWDEDAITSLGGSNGHAAYLGYFNLLLSQARLVDAMNAESKVRLSREAIELNDRITGALIRRLESSPITLLETYPNETYPVDNAAGIGSITLHARAVGVDREAMVSRWLMRWRRDYLDGETGLLLQSVRSSDGAPVDRPRGSGANLAAYFLSFVEDPISGELYAAAKRRIAGHFLGFGVVREYPPGESGRGDIDSGPIVLGYGFSATGFAIGGARAHGDRAYFQRLTATANLFGAPRSRGEERGYVAGGPLGDAIMLAMLTAQPARGTKASELPTTAAATAPATKPSEQNPKPK